MDGSDTRRGMPAVHRRFASLHRTEAWTGDPEAFGVGARSCSATCACRGRTRCSAAAACRPTGCSPGTGSTPRCAPSSWAGSTSTCSSRPAAAARRAALRVARYKSAKYTIEKPLHLGRRLAGAEQAVLDGYSGYGLPLGEAVPAARRRARRVRRPVGHRQARRRRPARGQAHGPGRDGARGAGSAQAAVVRRHLGDPHLSADGVAQLREVIQDTGALRRVEALIDELLDDALTALQAAPVAEDARQVLEGLAVAATCRTV
jgi:geranylgeranyl diphosphate synthase type I